MTTHPVDLRLVTEDELLRSALPAAVATASAGAAVSCTGHPVSYLDEEPAASGGSPVVLLDIEGLDGDPAEWCAKAVGQGRKVLVLHSSDDIAVLVACLEVGALGFQTKDLDLAGLTAAAQAVAAGEAVVPRQMLGGLLRDLIVKRRHDDERVRRYHDLTRREREVLGLLGNGLDPDAIAADLVISPQTARTHIQNILTKLDVHSRMEAVAFAHEIAGVAPPGRA